MYNPQQVQRCPLTHHHHQADMVNAGGGGTTCCGGERGLPHCGGGDSYMFTPPSLAREHPHSPAIPSPLHVLHTSVPAPCTNPIFYHHTLSPNSNPIAYHTPPNSTPNHAPALYHHAPVPSHAPSTTKKKKKPKTSVIKLTNWFFSVLPRSGAVVVLGNRE